MVSNSLNDGRSSQRDGTFSDVLSNPEHPLHPRTDFREPDEFNEETLRRSAERVVSVLAGRAAPGVRFEDGVIAARLLDLKREVDGALAKLGALEDSPADQNAKLLGAFEKVFRWIWADRKMDPEEMFRRLVGFTWLVFPNLTGASSQVELLRFAGMEDKQQLSRYVMAASELYSGYRNPLMRDEAAKKNMAKAALNRSGRISDAKEAHVTA